MRKRREAGKIAKIPGGGALGQKEDQKQEEHEYDMRKKGEAGRRA